MANHETTPGATVNFEITDNVKTDAENTIRVTVSASEGGEESVVYTTAWQGYGIPEAPKNVRMTFDEAANAATITWEAPTTGDDWFLAYAKLPETAKYFAIHHNKGIGQMVLPDVYDADDERQMQANNTSCFCYRQVAGSQKLSKHARGLAVDLNPLCNPYFRVRADGTRFVQPSTALRYCDRRRSFPCKITRSDLACRLFRQHGFEWGGDWTTCKDYQHFEFMEKQ